MSREASASINRETSTSLLDSFAAAAVQHGGELIDAAPSPRREASFFRSCDDALEAAAAALAAAAQATAYY